ncbi:MAG TPA: hypothetical protein PKC22_04690 [Rhodocyclaceae bacterium]|nr:hypothetical protein [Rhodocyclaceae bacterium]
MITNSTRTHIGVVLTASLLVLSGLSSAQPTFESASPTAGSDSSKKANEMADKAMYKEIEYANAKKAGPALIVIPGEVKSNNATFIQKFGPNNIADFAELELSKANFKVLERSDLGSLLSEIQLAYTMGDPQAARKHMQKGKLKTTKWIVKFDILKAEQVAQAQEGFDGRAAGRLLGIFGAFSGSLGGAQAGAVGETVVGSVQTKESSGVWVIGMRYKIMDANTTEQVAQGYTEEKMEVGAKGTSVMGVSSSAQGGVSLDTMVQRLVQKNVWDIDNKHK